MNIKQAAGKTGVSERNIRFYEQAGLLKIARQVNGYRFFNTQSIEDLQFIANAKIAGFSLEEMRSLLRLLHNANRQSADVHQIISDKLVEIDTEIIALQTSKGFLQRISQQCRNDESADCDILKNLKKKV